MSWFGRAQQPVQPAPRKGPPLRTYLLVTALLLGVGALVLADRSISTRTTPGAHSVTVTAPQAPPIRLPQVDGSTQAELAVLGSGAGWDAGTRAMGLFLADRVLWPGFLGLVIAVVFYAIPFIPDEWAWRLGIGCAVLIALSLLAPVVVVLLQDGEGMRNGLVTQATSPLPGH